MDKSTTALVFELMSFVDTFGVFAAFLIGIINDSDTFGDTIPFLDHADTGS